VRSIAEEAAARAKQVHLQSLRDKVHGKADAEKKKENAAPAPTTPEKKKPALPATTASLSKEISELTLSPAAAAGLQSPTTGAWRDGAAAGGPGGPGLRTLQSPTSTSWRPADVDPPVTSYQGARLESASSEEIAAIEKAQAIEERPDEEE